MTDPLTLLDELIADLCHGELNPAQRLEFERRLAQDPAALTTALQHWQLHRTLPHVVRGPQGDWFTAGVRAALEPATKPVRLRQAQRPTTARIRRSRRSQLSQQAQRSVRGRQTSALPWIGVAAAALAAVIAVAVHFQRAETTSSPSVFAPSAPAGIPGITTTGTGKLVWQDGAWFLGAGHLDIVADHRAHALVFATPHGRVAIIGTRFSLTVDATSTLIVVHEGRVRVGENNITHDVGAGESIRIPSVAPALAVAEKSPVDTIPFVGWELPFTASADSVWLGVRLADGGMRTVDNPVALGTGISMCSTERSMLAVPAESIWEVTYRSDAANARPGALWLYLHHADGRIDTTCQSDVQFEPGQHTLIVRAGTFYDAKTNSGVDPAESELHKIALLGWQGEVDDLVWLGCRVRVAAAP